MAALLHRFITRRVLWVPLARLVRMTGPIVSNISLKDFIVPPIYSHITVDTYCTASEEETQRESDHAYSLLEKMVSYQTKLVKSTHAEPATHTIDSIIEKIQLECSFKELLDVVYELSLLDRSQKVLALTHEKVHGLTERIAEFIPSVSDADLKAIVDCYTRLNCTGAPPYFKKEVAQLAMKIKNELLVREGTSVDSLLYFMDFFNHVNRRALSTSFLGKFTSEMKTLTKEQSILLLHCLSVSYTSHKRDDLLSELEEKIEEYFDDCLTQELAVASLGFFRSKYILTSEQLVERLSTRLLNDLENLSELTIVSLLKIINYSTRNGTAFTNKTVRLNMRGVTQALLPRLKDFSPSSCTNCFRISASLHQLNHNLMDALCQKVVNADIDDWRLKDLAWFTFTFGQFQCMVDDKQWFYDKIIRSLEQDFRRPEITRHPQALVQALVGLSLIGIYPNNLINEVMSPLFRNKMKSRIPLDLSRDLLFLDQSVRIERPQYDGLLLPDNFFNQIPKDHVIFRERTLPHDKNRKSKRDEMLLQIQSSLDLLCGRDMCAEIAFVFKHHNTADVVLKVDDQKKAIPIYDWSTTDLCVKDKSGQNTILVLIAAPNSYTVYDTEYGYSRKLLGSHATKRRQAELLGHKVVEIPYFKWYDKGTNRREYLVELLTNYLSFDR